VIKKETNWHNNWNQNETNTKSFSSDIVSRGSIFWPFKRDDNLLTHSYAYLDIGDINGSENLIERPTLFLSFKDLVDLISKLLNDILSNDQDDK